MAEWENLKDSTIGRWIAANGLAPNFAEALKTLVSYACAEWFRRCTGAVLAPGEALSRVLLARLPGISLASWLESPVEHSLEIADFCEKTKVSALPDALQCELPTFLDLRGWQATPRGRPWKYGSTTGALSKMYPGRWSPTATRWFFAKKQAIIGS